jgi:aminopeptidase-like protein
VSADAADDLRRALDALEPRAFAVEIEAGIRELYPICRSVTGDGVRRSLRVLQRIAPIELHEVPSGTQVFDWVVPREWTFRAARLVGPTGELVLDAAKSNLHVLNYSAPFKGRVTLEELQKHLHSLPEKPSLVPYRTSYYREDWGFCLSDAQRSRLAPGLYEVDIDTTLADGALTYGELVVRGALDAEVLVSTHVCHPSLANDNCAGMVMCATIARLLYATRPRYSYRFLFAPGTIGAITWLALHERDAKRIAHGLTAACVGGAGRFTYKRSRRGSAEIDRAAAHVLAHCGEEHEVRDFAPYGYDERQYCSPAFDLAVGSLTRTPYGEFPEYHTSADDLSFVRPDKVVGTLRRYLEVLEVLEGNGTYVNLSPRCEPQLGRRGLFGAMGGRNDATANEMALLWVLNLSDGTRSLLDVAERARMPFREIRRAARALERAGLLAQTEGVHRTEGMKR